MCIFVSNKAKLLSIAVATVNDFNAVRGKKTIIKIRVFMCYEYSSGIVPSRSGTPQNRSHSEYNCEVKNL